MPGLFDPTQINGMKIKNRFVRSATHEDMATHVTSAFQRSLWKRRCIVPLKKSKRSK